MIVYSKDSTNRSVPQEMPIAESYFKRRLRESAVRPHGWSKSVEVKVDMRESCQLRCRPRHLTEARNDEVRYQ
ncbi:hypothetical protein TNCV_2949081 [Trichonephila clavipes]|nr:hypothetical protein TNCV_2949081 [Trichonephila clavipes]